MASRGEGGQPSDLPREVARRRRLPYTRIARWALAGAAVLVVLVLLNVAKDVYTDWLWFDGVGYRDVYSKGLFTRVWLFFAGAAVFLAVFLGNILLAQRLARRNEPAVLPPGTIMVIRGATRLGVLFFTLVLTLIFGLLASNEWDDLLRFAHAQPFVDSAGLSLADPLFGHNPSYYVFSLPLLEFIQTWLLGLTVVALLGTIAIYAVGFSLRGFRLTYGWEVKAHLTLLFAVLALVVGWGYWIDSQELVLGSRGLGGMLFGANATDATAKLFALRFMMGITGLAALALAISAFRRGIAFPILCFGAWLGSVLFVLWLYPAAYHRFSVKPNELARETPYIERNIQWTREAYGLSRLSAVPLPIADGPPEEGALGSALSDVRLWGPRPVIDSLAQAETLRLYYRFSSVDVDRYPVSGRLRQVIVAPRELSIEEVPGPGWVARRLQYTHGFGVAAVAASEATANGRPRLLEWGAPSGVDAPLAEPRIYYGERTDHYVIVRTRTQEFDYPSEQGGPQFTSYRSDGGVRLSSLLRRAALAWKLRDINMLASDQITPESRVLFHRSIRKRVGHIAPFLRLDPDPYPAVADGKLWWILDAYTTTERFPYAQPDRAGFNYIRNSVKVVVNAYTGYVDFYLADPDDAIARSHARAFPGLFKPLSAMPPALRQHLRYPRELFSAQAAIFRTYHTTDPKALFTREDVWVHPVEVSFGTRQAVEPYYALVPGSPAGAEFLLLLPLTRPGRPETAAILAGRSNGEGPGELLALTPPAGSQVDGPTRAESRITSDLRVSQQLALWVQQGFQVLRGNLLAVPAGGTMLYVEPVYVQPASGPPEMRRVIVIVGSGPPAMEPTPERALEVALGRAVPSPLSVPTLPPTGAVPQGPALTGTELEALIRELERLLEQLRRLRDQR